MADAVELKPSKDSPESNPSVVLVRKNVPREIAEDSQKKPSRSIAKTPLRTYKERPLRRTPSATIQSVGRKPKSDVCIFLFAK